MNAKTRMGRLALAGGVAVGFAAIATWRFGAPVPALAAPGDTGVPVVLGTAASADVPLYVRGLGSVQAYNAVTVRSRVDGQIMQVLFTEGQEVKAGDRLFQIDPRPYQAALDQAQANKLKDSASLGAAKLDLNRYNALVGEGYQTRQSVDQQKGTVGAGQGSIAADEAAIEAARLNLDYADIHSPIEGRTGARLVDIGNLVQAAAGTALVTITQIHPIYVTFTVPQGQLDAIRQAQGQASLDVEAYSDDDKAKLAAGKLTLIDNQVDAATGTIRLKASFENKDERLWPGEFVNARLVLRVQRGVVTVPAPAVMNGNEGQYVFVVKPDNTVERRTVEIGSNENGIIVVAKGVKNGDRVVVDGQYRLSEGAKVRTVEASG